MFFVRERLHFFRPLTTKYRQQVLECLCLLHERLYGATAEYGQSLGRDQVLDVFEEALARAPVLEAMASEGSSLGDVELEPIEQRFKNHREHAGWVLKLLLEHGWLERQVDAATLQSSYPLSRAGRLFIAPMVEMGSRRVRTRHRNTRNTLNALEAFASRGEIHDLLDAFEYSERIITDFTDIISELEERKRELVQEVESQRIVQQATEQFFEFMEKRFQPDVSVRLSADSVEKHRDRVFKAITRIRRKDKAFKQAAERRLRELAPELIHDTRQSALWYVLDTIDQRMRRAADTMLPALRSALAGFTKRADIIIRQLSYLANSARDPWLEACDNLRKLPPQEAEQRLTQLGEYLSGVNVRLVDPAQVRLSTRKSATTVMSALEEERPLDPQAQKELLIQQMLDQAFVINDNRQQHYLRTHIESALRNDQSIATRDLPIDNASDLLAVAHAIESASRQAPDANYRFKVKYLNRQYQNNFFSTADDFELSLSYEADAPISADENTLSEQVDDQ